MEIVIGGLGAMSLINTLSKDIVMKSIQRALNGTCGTIMWFASYDQPYAKEIITEIRNLDLEFNVNLIKKLLEDINKNKYKIDSQAILYAMEQVNYQLELVHAELRDFQSAIEKHKNKYFNGWRCLTCRSSISNLVRNTNILVKRYDELVKLLNIVDKQIL